MRPSLSFNRFIHALPALICAGALSLSCGDGYSDLFESKGRNGDQGPEAAGIPDETFDLGTGPNSIIYAIAVQSGGYVIVGGSLTSYDGTPCNYLMRLQ